MGPLGQAGSFTAGGAVFRGGWNDQNLLPFSMSISNLVTLAAGFWGADLGRSWAPRSGGSPIPPARKRTPPKRTNRERCFIGITSKRGAVRGLTIKPRSTVEVLLILRSVP